MSNHLAETCSVFTSCNVVLSDWNFHLYLITQRIGDVRPQVLYSYVDISIMICLLKLSLTQGREWES